jgi:oxalate decarboxylase/phosphoglucose isomerase-like protein (cupin superfamily)
MTADATITEEQGSGPGAQNPRHYHPNCDEVLHVLQGRILHSVDDDALHNARNIGDEEAVFVFAFSSADRHTLGE